ncbi:larval cuticle protein 65Ab1-like [Musca vetustissima]|uniref:larval cuticle protein 65Ab1-like n=1 Tax=Musca vetustissima TaxID=27455 RepID=UPI002AB6D8A6|nr:larval cuticle protein 65Ab1-like [Musca vetustissima]
MKFLIVFVALFAIALAAPRPDVEIVKSEVDVEPEGYAFNVATSDGTAHEENGKLKDVGTDHEAIVVHGSYTWVDEKTGQKFTVTYVADENGFQPQGEHLPVA